MPTLLDALNQTLSQASTSKEPVQDETQEVQRLLAAKRGIVGPSTGLGPQGLAVGEMAAKLPSAIEKGEVGQAAQMESTSLMQQAAAQAEETKQRKSDIAFQRQQNQLQARIQSDAILRNLEQNRAALSEAQRRSGMEQVAAQLRLQDTAYIDNLQREGARARLKDSIAFDEQLRRDVAGENIALLQTKFNNRSLLDMSDNEFKKALAQIDIDTAIGMNQQNIDFMSKQAQIQALGQGAVTGIGAYGTYSEQEAAGKYDEGYQAYKTNALQSGVASKDIPTYEVYKARQQAYTPPVKRATPQ